MTAGATGRSPRLRLHATRRPSTEAGTTGSRASGGAATDFGSRPSRPASAPSSRAASSTLRAIGPNTDSDAHGSDCASAAGMRPGEGRSPTTPQNDDGLRMLDARSDPSANGSIPLATATAAPPLLPPGVKVASCGFNVAPNTRLNVFEPAANSGVFVLPMMTAPARRRRSARMPSASGTWSAKIVDPYVVRIPAVSSMSLTAIGRPWSGPSASPRATASSAARAWARAPSSSSVTIAFRRGLTSAIRARCVSSTSVADSEPSAIPAASRRALLTRSPRPRRSARPATAATRPQTPRTDRRPAR